MAESLPLFERPVDKKRMQSLFERTETPLESNDIGYIYTVMTQCFLPYVDPGTRDWNRRNGAYSVMLTAGTIEDPASPTGFRNVGLPYGAKPRLFQSYISTLAVKMKSKVVPIENTMCAMMRELGFETSGGPKGPIRSFKEQITRFARADYVVVGPGPLGSREYITAKPVKRFSVFFSVDPGQDSLWPNEIELTDEFYESLLSHAVPFSFPALRSIMQKPRALDIYLWLTQRLCRIPYQKPLLMKWRDLYVMFGGQCPYRRFKQHFREDLVYARMAYPEARMEERSREGFLFKSSPPPIPKKQVM